MPICSKCNSVIDDESEKCPFCGTVIDQSKEFGEGTNSTHVIKRDELDASQLIVEKQKIAPQPSSDEAIDAFVLKSPDIEEIELEEHQDQKISVSLSPVPERNFLLWFVLGIITVGIGFLIYLYLNLEDLEKHSHYPLELKAEPMKINTSSLLMLFFFSICCLFIPILWYMYYLKYASLYNHIREQKNETAPVKISRPIFYMISLVGSHLLALVPSIVMLATSIDLRTTYPIWFWILTASIIICTLITAVFDYYWQRAFNQHCKIAMINLNIMEESAG